MVADRADSDPGFVGERLEQLGAELVPSLREDFPAAGPVVDADAVDLVLLLGSHHGVSDPGREDVVGVESALVRDSLARGVPVVGICYGAQLAAHALGGRVSRAAEREIGWYYVESHDPALCPPGPWVQYHYDRFTVPEGTRSLGQSDTGPQGFALESDDGVLRLVAWQFHPEVTPEILKRWVTEDAEVLPGQGVDAEAFVAEAQQREAFSRAGAHALVDVTLDAMGLLPARP
jgi:GMP synthase-like glutamine amidotransferase